MKLNKVLWVCLISGSLIPQLNSQAAQSAQAKTTNVGAYKFIEDYKTIQDKLMPIFIVKDLSGNTIREVDPTDLSMDQGDEVNECNDSDGCYGACFWGGIRFLGFDEDNEFIFVTIPLDIGKDRRHAVFILTPDPQKPASGEWENVSKIGIVWGGVFSKSIFKSTNNIIAFISKSIEPGGLGDNVILLNIKTQEVIYLPGELIENDETITSITVPKIEWIDDDHLSYQGKIQSMNGGTTFGVYNYCISTRQQTFSPLPSVLKSLKPKKQKRTKKMNSKPVVPRLDSIHSRNSLKPSGPKSPN